jgi:hypothetical protein
MSGLIVSLALILFVALPIIVTGMSMLPGVEDAMAGTAVNRPKKAGPALFFYLLGFRAAPLLRVFA